MRPPRVPRFVRRLVTRWSARPLPAPIYPRHLVFQGMVNFRDLGGLPAASGVVRSGVLFRSDSLAYATRADAFRLVDDLRLATVIDLRGPYEVSRLGRGPLADTAVTYVSAPIADVSGSGEMAHHYLAILDEKGGVLAGMIRLLAGVESLPAVFHCEAGCDRTGVLAAVVLSLLGVPDDEITADYALTATVMPAIHQRVRVVATRLGFPAPTETTWAPEAEMMGDALRLAKEKWGGIREWANAHGVTDDTILALRAALVVDDKD